MSRKRGNLSVRIEDRDDGRYCSVIHRGASGRQYVEKPTKLDGDREAQKEQAQALVEKGLGKVRLPSGTS